MSLTFESYVSRRSDGFIKSNNIKSTKILSTSLKSTVELDISAIQNGLTHDLLKEILRTGDVKFSKHYDKFDYDTIYTASICIAPHGVEFAKVNDDMFCVNNEQFNEDEIKQALRHTFPERFL